MDKYCNPIKKHGDFADPFVLRFNGKYYLYCTNPDIRCWSSIDLVHWKSEGPTIADDEFPGLVPFAPEVVYWNGSFYMVTSPSGHGHYVLKSDSPTGPFKKITGNIGHAIDLTIFIDDDGKWYAYWANERGIVGCEMKSPTEFGKEYFTGAFMHGWTEGAFVVKANGKYHMTYTGNHYLSNGYRINAAVSDHPLTGYKDNPHNPVIVRTEGEVVGLGHSSTVLGPDLLTHYIVYHNINPDATRDLNIDVVLLKDDGAAVLGPTRYAQPAPLLPVFFDSLDSENDGEMWAVQRGGWRLSDGFHVSDTGSFCCLCKKTLPACGVVELHLASDGPDQNYGIVFIKEKDVLEIRFVPKDNQIVLYDRNRGIPLVAKHLLPDYNHEALHSVCLNYNDSRFTLFIDGKKTAEIVGLNDYSLAGYQVGYFSEGSRLRMGYTAFNPGDTEKADETVYYPVPCSVPVFGKYTIFHLNVNETGDYLFTLRGGKLIPENTILSACLDGEKVPCTAVDRSTDQISFSLCMTAGLHAVSFRGEELIHSVESVAVHKRALREKAELSVEEFGPYDKQYCGETQACSYDIEAELTVNGQSEHWQAGVLFRATELSDGGEGNDKVLGTNFFIGYRAAIENNRLILTKHRYDETLLACAAVSCNRSGSYTLRIRAKENDITVYFGNCEQPTLICHDIDPILFGRVGSHARECILEKGTIKAKYH